MKKINSKMKVLEYFSHYKSMGIFPDAQGQLTHKSLVRSCPNPFEILWFSLLPARIKKNKSKMKELEWSQDFPNYNPMGAICCHGNQSSDPIIHNCLIKVYRRLLGRPVLGLLSGWSITIDSI